MHGVEAHLAEQHGGDVADHHADEDREATEQTAEQHGAQHHGGQGDDRGERGEREVVAGRRRQVEADQGDDRTADDRGSSESIQRVPARFTTTPMTASSAPTTMMPLSASGMPPTSFAAAIGARNANDDPR